MLFLIKGIKIDLPMISSEGGSMWMTIDSFSYKGGKTDALGTSIRWLLKDGDDAHGYPEYGLFFTIQPGG